MEPAEEAARGEHGVDDHHGLERPEVAERVAGDHHPGARDDHVEEVRETMREILLETAAEYFPQVPFKADVKVGVRLGDLT